MVESVWITFGYMQWGYPLAGNKSPKGDNPMLLRQLEEMFKDSSSFHLPALPVLHSHKEQCNLHDPGRKKGKGKEESQLLAPLVRIK